MTERLCPFDDGRHKKRPWYEREKGVAKRSGLACIRCGKTWQFNGKALVATWDLLRDRDAAPRKAEGFEAEGQQPGPRSGIAKGVS